MNKLSTEINIQIYLDYMKVYNIFVLDIKEERRIMDKAIEIQTNGIKFYKEYLTLLRPLIKLRDQEMDVFAEILYYNNKYREIPIEDRNKMIFSPQVKKDIMNKLKLKPASFYNVMSALKKHGVIIDAGGSQILSPKHEILPDKQNNIIFRFNINDI